MRSRAQRDSIGLWNKNVVPATQDAGRHVYSGGMSERSDLQNPILRYINWFLVEMAYVKYH